MNTVIDLRENHSLESIEQLILSHKQNNPHTPISLIDKGYSLLSEDNSQEITVSEHLNLSTSNPTINKHPVKFYAIDNLYYTSENNSSEKIACLQENITPTEKQKTTLQEQGINYYCYKLPLIALLCAYNDIQVAGKLIINSN